ncbi:putative white-brown complex homolog protein 30 isoform X1 [Durio zibethinus]|uniref:White-brown complex homolog protein 30 isoform X1 n=1 Tax=Durio zibethinus TaxID=66656 RepID=A0A6P5YR17_DURZI|nr:putative white-brown complex homolog protein 30 isoform X1 [Durio zibethinus]
MRGVIKPHALLFLLVVLSLFPFARSVDGDDYSQTKNPAYLPLVTDLIYKRLSNLTVILSNDISHNMRFCIKDAGELMHVFFLFREADWNGAFNFSRNLDFLSNCVKKTKGDLTQRLCTAAEIKFYFSSLFAKGTGATNYVKPNKNCNLTSWVSGCEPGWGCNADENQHVELKNSTYMPSRTQNCQPCCEGFFCPRGLACMIPCPLGSYCPLAKLNTSTGVCDPYNYQIPPGQPNHSCGGADSWADVASSSEIFCSPGSYCPSTITKVTCSTGHYCRMGSTSQLSCFKLTTCNPNTSNQNIHGYGVMIFVGMSLLLLIIYNCSDQVLSTRERRQAKSREAAARHARETAQARERWKAAKDIAKKGGWQQQLSRTFSRAKSHKRTEQQKMFGIGKSVKVDTQLPPAPPRVSEQSSTDSKAKKKEPSSLTKMLHSLEEDPKSHEGFNLNIGDKNIKKQAPKGKQLHTQSQIFKYAYGQIEKEKAQQNKNLTFSGIISMATDNDIRTRPVIEIYFKDLTLALKRKHKHLLRCVTGKLMPGRVSAVMGPSGAGKTTFLSALTGKTAAGCNVTGLILVNGKNEPIQSYKKIIGYVPQDDIVHGNLTVEENLRFSARCRLSADMAKPDKVLVIERVIESLGLQAVRDSLVGTVEKRGISGGQRKRVNVGLEMVMEPSLLILDEPTTGLDSSSSQLLLRALRREALEGVNICMVLHQPSYTLFKMFDDLILLAKGGLIAYHGSVKKVEEYFAGMGINVPERVNPPDHLIDILEGIVKPTGVTREQLPIRWMLHNGYPIPADMLDLVDELSTASGSNPNISGAAAVGQSFAGDRWEDVKSSDEVKHDRYSKSHDLSNRRTPGILRQYRYFLGRSTKQRLREAQMQAVDLMILLLAGACLGTLAKVNDETFGSLGYTYTVIAISLLCKIAALRSFSLDKLQYQRESAAGISSLAYFLSKDTVDQFNTIIKPVAYLSMFYFFNNPRSTFQDNYIVLLCLVYCVTGIAYILAIFFAPSVAQLWAVLLPVVLTLVANQDKDSAIVKYFGNFCYTKWALEAFVIANAQRYSGVWLITRCGSLKQGGYDLHDWNLCLIILVINGIIARIIAFFILITFRKK